MGGGMGGGMSGGMSGMRMGGFGFDDENMFGSFGGSSFGPSAARGPRQPPPVTQYIDCTLEELYKGKEIRKRLTKQVLNPDGTTGPQQKVLQFKISPGFRAGTKVRFEREGDQAPGIIPSDIVFVLRQKPHDRFDRAKDDLIYRKYDVTLSEALTGTTLEIKTVDNRLLRIPINEIIYPGYEKIVYGEGMPKLKDPSQRGNLTIRFNIVFPKYLSSEEKVKLREVLRNK